jgi:hypothetical protein
MHWHIRSMAIGRWGLLHVRHCIYSIFNILELRDAGDILEVAEDNGAGNHSQEVHTPVAAAMWAEDNEVLHHEMLLVVDILHS